MRIERLPPGVVALVVLPLEIAEPLPLELAFVRDVRDEEPPVFVFDSGGVATFLLPIGRNPPRARFRAPDGDRALRVTLDRDLPNQVARARVTLPERVGEGRLELLEGHRRLRVRVELSAPAKKVEARLQNPDVHLLEVSTSTDAAAAMLAWRSRFRAHYRAHQSKAALEMAEAWAADAERRGRLSSTIRAWTVVAFLHLVEGRVRPAARAALLALTLAEQLPVRLDHGVARVHLAQVLLADGAPEAAERTAGEASRILLRADLESEAQHAIAIQAVSRTRLGRFEAALELLEAHPLAANTSSASRAVRLANEGDLLLQMWARKGEPADLEGAIERIEQSRALYAGIGLRSKVFARDAEVAWALARSGQTEAAKARLEGIEESKVEASAAGLVPLTRGQIALLEGRPAEALEVLEPVVAAPPSRWDALEATVEATGRELLAHALFDLGRSEDAVRALEEALDAAYAIAARTSFAGAPAAALDRREPLRRSAIAALVRRGLVGRAFALDDRHRALVLKRLDHIRGRDALSAAARELRASLEARLGEVCLPPASDERCAGRARSLLLELDTLTGSPDSAAKLFELVARREEEGSVRGGFLSEPVNGDRDPAHGFHLKDRRGAGRVTPVDADRGAPIHPVEAAARRAPPPQSDLGTLASHLRPREVLWVSTASGTASNRGFIVEAGRPGVRYEPVLDPDAITGVEHLYFVTEDLERAIRLAARLARREAGPTMSVLPYASWLLRPVPPVGGSAAVVVADTLADLPGARAEGEAVIRRFPEAMHWLGAGLRFSELSKALRSASLFHFAGHGDLLGQDPWATLLRLGPDAVLTVHDWLRAPVPLALAVLDGCLTAGRRARPGEVGFPQAMLQTGTRSVLATVRPVRDGPAARFVDSFYKGDGRRFPARGHRAAMRSSLRRGDGAWTAFVLWGRP